MLNIKKIHQFNPWFTDKKFVFGEKSLKKRLIYKKIQKALDLKMILSLSGLRRTGKTTLLRQLANSFLTKKSQVFYYQFDELDTNLSGALEFFFSQHLGDDLHTKEMVYILLDELQYVKHWQNILKYYYDINKNIQFIVTGSTSLYLYAQTKESLAGRIVDFAVQPLSFDEYLYFKKNIQPLPLIDATQGPTEIVKQISYRSHKLVSYRDEVWDFMVKGEFPALLDVHLDEFISIYLGDSILDKIFRKDIQVFEVEKLSELRKLYTVLLQNSAQVVSNETLSREIAISRTTLKVYQQILEYAYLIKLVKNDLRSVRAQEKAQKKIMSVSLNLVTTALGISDVKNMLFPDFRGHLIENYVFNQLTKRFKNIDKIYYYNKDKKEVDFVMTAGSMRLPIEVKQSSKLKRTDLNHIFYYMQKHDLTVGLCLYGGGGEYGVLDMEYGGGDVRKKSAVCGENTECVRRDGRVVYLVGWW